MSSVTSACILHWINVCVVNLYSHTVKYFTFIQVSKTKIGTWLVHAILTCVWLGVMTLDVKKTVVETGSSECLFTVVTGPVKGCVALLISDDRNGLYWLGSMQKSPQNPNVATGGRKVHRWASPTVPYHETGTVLQQSLDTLLMTCHRLDETTHMLNFIHNAVCYHIGTRTIDISVRMIVFYSKFMIYPSVQSSATPLVFGIYISSFINKGVNTVGVSTQHRQHQRSPKKTQIWLIQHDHYWGSNVQQ